MAVIFTAEGGSLKVEENSAINYYPLDDVRLRTGSVTIEVIYEGKVLHNFPFGDVTPSGASPEIVADAISALLDTGGGGGASAANQLLQTAELEDIADNTTSGDLNKLLTQANDLVHTYTWLDGGAADQRISTVVYSSTALGLSVTETFTYSGGSGTYHVATSTLS